MKKIGILVSLIMGLSACGSITTRKVEADQVSGIRRAAVASFTVTQPVPRSIGLNLSSGRAEGSNEASLIAGSSSTVDQMYQDLVTAFQKRMKWNVLSKDQLAANAGYAKAYNDMMKGWQSKAAPHGDYFNVLQIMDSQSVRRMKPEARDELMQALNVDAIVEADLNIFFKTKGMAVMGIASRYPQTRLSFWVYKKGVKDVVWFDGNIDGDISTQSVGKTGFFDKEEVTRLGRTSAVTAFNKISAETTKE
jgi:hypothetical protein